MSVEDNSPQEDGSQGPNHFNTFLRLLQEGISRARRSTCEPLVDYNQSQILTSTQHVHNLEDFASKKVQIQEEKEERARNRKLIKNVKAQEKLQKVAEKDAIAATK